MTVSDRIQDVMRDVFDDPGLVVSRSMTAADVEAWDSLTHINLLVAVEREFKFRFSLVETKGLKNVGEMMDLVEKKTKN